MAESKLLRIITSSLFGLFLALMAWADSKYPTDMTFARILLFSAWIAISVGIWVSRDFFSFRPLLEKLAALGAILLLGAGLLAFDRWEISKIKTETKGLKTLHDLYWDNCKGDHTVSVIIKYPLKCNDQPVSRPIEIMRCGKLDIKTEYGNVYLPDSQCSWGYLRDMNKIYNKMIEDSSKEFDSLHYDPPGEKPIYWKNYVGSGRIYIYHETEYSRTDMDKLIEILRKDGLDPIFRGREYLIVVNSPLYRPKEAK